MYSFSILLALYNFIGSKLERLKIAFSSTLGSINTLLKVSILTINILISNIIR